MGAETDADVRVAWSPRGNPAQVWLLNGTASALAAGTGHGRPILWQLRNSAGAPTSPVLPGDDGKQN
jgi:hypothetical protein